MLSDLNGAEEAKHAAISTTHVYFIHAFLIAQFVLEVLLKRVEVIVGIIVLSIKLSQPVSVQIVHIHHAAAHLAKSALTSQTTHSTHAASKLTASSVTSLSYPACLSEGLLIIAINLQNSLRVYLFAFFH
jgi:hypothetical protein